MPIHSTALPSSNAVLFGRAGNIKGIGSDLFRYDAASRLVKAQVDRHIFQPSPGTKRHYFLYEHDIYGNLRACCTNPPLDKRQD